jgi:hypothetical protein
MGTGDGRFGMGVEILAARVGYGMPEPIPIRLHRSGCSSHLFGKRSNPIL